MKLFDDVEVQIDHELDTDFNKVVKVTVKPQGRSKFVLDYKVGDASIAKLKRDVRERLDASV